MSNILFLLFILFAVFLLLDCGRKTDKFSDIGALTQLYAKGPQDLYLTTDTEKYMYPQYWGRYGPWNMQTRLDNYYYPSYGIFPPLY